MTILRLHRLVQARKLREPGYEGEVILVNPRNVVAIQAHPSTSMGHSVVFLVGQAGGLEVEEDVETISKLVGALG